MEKQIEELYDEIYEQIARQHEKVLELAAEQAKEQFVLSTKEEEKLVRMELALQISKDILENMMMPGTTMTIMHPKGSLTIDLHENK
ncbi:hypothetical protein [Metabacillus arenae]|uniref:Uncharacterized protein n=1 Tax=Metabacillus arenae TaxID=2771434 RepID=A0A926RVJ6_9BACI|nr:hypothetical protein [Metabacillus arenae]MBD1379758.1 hypothetical protein [Metabacillus arenae]